MKPPKKIHTNSLTGAKGVNLIERVVQDLGFLWYPTGGVEGGVDGIIEIRDAQTGEITNSIIQVQSKATVRDWAGETETRFEYLCGERDIDYWLRGNAPIILVVSRPDQNLAYWVSLKDYFRDPTIRRSRKIIFDKIENRFDSNCRQALLDLALPRDAGVYLAPLRRSETLYSNLIEVESFFEEFYVAPTQYRRAGDLIRDLRAAAPDASDDWVLRDGMLYSPNNLQMPPWNHVCDAGAAEPIPSYEFANSDDRSQRNLFVRLLNVCLQEMAWSKPQRIGFNRGHGYLYFRPSDTLDPITISYRAATNMTERDVFAHYKKEEGVGGYYRHSAFWGRFIRFDLHWYLEVTPTYHYTSDGRRECPDALRETLLTGIKKLEKNPSLLGQLFMWASVLKPTQDIFANQYPFLRLGNLRSFTLEAGLDDAEWRRKMDEGEAESVGFDDQANLGDQVTLQL